MEFKIDNAMVSDNTMEDYIKILRHYDLKIKGLFVDDTGKISFGNNMEHYITISSLEDLMQLQEDLDEPLVIDKNEITIYDGYME